MDVHRENLIIHNKEPYLIDLENSFIPKKNEIALELALDPQSGAFSRENQCVNISPIYIQNADTNSILQIPKYKLKSTPADAALDTSLFWQMLFTTKFIRIEHDKNFVQFGMEKLFSIVRNNKSVFLQWLNSDLVKKLIIRDVPIATADYYNFYFKEREKNLNRFISDQAGYHFDAFANLETDRRTFIIFNEKFKNDIKHKIIPSFYASVTQKYLYNSEGKKVKQDESLINFQELKKSKSNLQEKYGIIPRKTAEELDEIFSKDKDFYYPITPLEHVLNNFENLDLTEQRRLIKYALEKLEVINKSSSNYKRRLRRRLK